MSNVTPIAGRFTRWVCVACRSPRVYEEMRVNMNDAHDARTFGTYYCAACEQECDAVEIDVRTGKELG